MFWLSRNRPLLLVEADFFKSAVTILYLTFSIKNWKSKVQNDHVLIIKKSASTMRSIRNTPPFGDPIGSHKRFILSNFKDNLKKRKLNRYILNAFVSQQALRDPSEKPSNHADIWVSPLFAKAHTSRSSQGVPHRPWKWSKFDEFYHRFWLFYRDYL